MKEKDADRHHHNKKHHHHHHDHKHGHSVREIKPKIEDGELKRVPNVRDFSIFNQVTVNAPVQQDQEREDGIASCFKSLFQCGKK